MYIFCIILSCFWGQKLIFSVNNNLSIIVDVFCVFLLDKDEAKHDPNLRHNALLVWAPVDEIPNAKCK